MFRLLMSGLKHFISAVHIHELLNDNNQEMSKKRTTSIFIISEPIFELLSGLLFCES